MLKNNKKLFWAILTSFLIIPLIVSVISTIHVVNFFELSNYRALAIALSLSFEIGALSALAGLVVLDKINKNVIYFIFIVLTMYQMMGNTYFAYDMLSEKMKVNPDLVKNWTELFGFDSEDNILIKRLIAIISGAILPIVSLCFLDLSVNYIKKSAINEPEEIKNDSVEPIDSDGLKKKLKSSDDEVEIKNPEPIIQSIVFDDEEDEEEFPFFEDLNVQEETVVEQPIEQNEIILEQPIEQKNDVISEEEKKSIRELVNEIKDEETNPKNKNVINLPHGKTNRGNFHNVVYTK